MSAKLPRSSRRPHRSPRHGARKTVRDDSCRSAVAVQNRTGKVAPEHWRLNRYGTMTLDEICALPVADIAAEPGHLYLWVPNALLPHGLRVMEAWGYRYISNIVWHKVRKDGGSDGRGVGFYFRNVTELLLFGVRGKDARTLAPGRSQVNMLQTRKREHSRKPDEQYDVIESCSWGPRLELFSRGKRNGWCGATRRTKATSRLGTLTATTRRQAYPPPFEGRPPSPPIIRPLRPVIPSALQAARLEATARVAWAQVVTAEPFQQFDFATRAPCDGRV